MSFEVFLSAPILDIWIKIEYMKDNLVECGIGVHNLDTEKEHLEHELNVQMYKSAN